MNDEQREKARFILMHYGAANQRHQLIEECAELIQAINKYERATSEINIFNAKDNILSEIADVLIMIEQISMSLFNDDKSFVNAMIEYKLNRQLNRIKEENEL